MAQENDNCLACDVVFFRVAVSAHFSPALGEKCEAAFALPTEETYLDRHAGQSIADDDRAWDDASITREPCG